MARILYRDAQGNDGSVELDSSETCFIGRALDCAIRTDDALVSRRHSKVYMNKNGQFVVEDLGSSNGTAVNDRRVVRHTLVHQDMVKCGSLLLRFVDVPEMSETSMRTEKSQDKVESTDNYELDDLVSTLSGTAKASPRSSSAAPTIAPEIYTEEQTKTRKQAGVNEIIKQMDGPRRTETATAVDSVSPLFLNKSGGQPAESTAKVARNANPAALQDRALEIHEELSKLLRDIASIAKAHEPGQSLDPVMVTLRKAIRVAGGLRDLTLPGHNKKS